MVNGKRYIVMKKYLLCVVITILFVACDSTNDLGTPFTKGQEVTLTAIIGEQRPQLLPRKQRVSGVDAGEAINLVWNEGDQIKVIVEKESAIFTLTSGTGSSDGTFTGIMPADGNSFRVEYPISEPDISTQTYIKDGFSNGLMKMVAENGTIDGGFILKAQHALLGLQLMGNQTLSRIVVTNPTDQKTYTLNCSNVALSQSPTLFYIVVPAGEWGNGFKVDIYDSNNTHQKTLTKSSTALFFTTQAMIMPVQGLDMIFNVNGVTFKMIYVEGGTFMMGAMEGDQSAFTNEKPAHEVKLTYDYYIGQTEVTQALWQAVMDNNPSTMEGDNLPVNNVLWEEADAFTKQLSQLTGYTFNLPTEAEWEYAARGGKESKGYLYAGSDNVNEVAWYSANSGNKTHDVGTKKPNELGIYDMSGNAWEWCSDWLVPYPAEAQVDPTGPATGEYHVYRGGGWYIGASTCRCTHRRQTREGYSEYALGLRVALREKVER